MNPEPQPSAAITFGRWLGVFIAGFAISNAILIIVIALSLRLQPAALVVPYLLIVWTGFVAGVAIYWARQGDLPSKARAARFTLAVGFVSMLYFGVMLFTAVKTSLVSGRTALESYAPYIVLTSLIGSASVYLTLRRRQTSQRRD